MFELNNFVLVISKKISDLIYLRKESIKRKGFIFKLFPAGKIKSIYVFLLSVNPNLYLSKNGFRFIAFSALLLFLLQKYFLDL